MPPKVEDPAALARLAKLLAPAVAAVAQRAASSTKPMTQEVRRVRARPRRPA